MKNKLLLMIIGLLFLLTLPIFSATIRVLLADNLDSVVLTSVSGFKLKNGGTYMPLIPKDTPLIITPQLGNISYSFNDINTTNHLANNITFAPMTEGLKNSDVPLILVDIIPAKRYNLYRGEMEVSVNPSGKLTLINRVDLESYLYSVVAAEMGASRPLEALKCQAIAARSYAARRINRADRKFDVYDTVMSQVYNGYLYEQPTTVRAVNETKDQVLFDKSNNILDAMFFSTCGGFTESATNGAHYLVSVNDCGAKRPTNENEWHQFYTNPQTGNCYLPDTGFLKNYRWSRTFNINDLNNNFSQKAITGNITGINVLKRSVGGRINSIEIVGEQDNVTINGELNIRNAFSGLMSSGFSILKTDTDFIFYGAGYGHGLGMCQVGVIGQALKGRKCHDILKFYYQGAEIRRL